jgi:hypothetical protein
MKYICVFFALTASGALAQAQTSGAHSREQSSADVRGGGDTIEFTDANGKSTGSVTTIAGTTYYIGPDGATLGTSKMVDGRRVYKSY